MNEQHCHIRKTYQINSVYRLGFLSMVNSIDLLECLQHPLNAPKFLDTAAMMLVRWLEAHVGTSDQEKTMDAPKQLSCLNFTHRPDLFKTTCKVLKTANSKALEKIQRLMP